MVQYALSRCCMDELLPLAFSAQPLPDGYEVRLAEPDDSAGIGEMLRRSGRYFDPRDSVEALLSRPPNTTHVAVRPDGAICGVAYSELTPARIMLDGLTVDPEERGKDIGIHLAEGVAKTASDLGYTMLEGLVDLHSGRPESAAPLLNWYMELGASEQGNAVMLALPLRQSAVDLLERTRVEEWALQTLTIDPTGERHWPIEWAPKIAPFLRDPQVCAPAVKALVAAAKEWPRLPGWYQEAGVFRVALQTIPKSDMHNAKIRTLKLAAQSGPIPIHLLPGQESNQKYVLGSVPAAADSPYAVFRLLPRDRLDKRIVTSEPAEGLYIIYDTEHGTFHTFKINDQGHCHRPIPVEGGVAQNYLYAAIQAHQQPLVNRVRRLLAGRRKDSGIVVA